jgi:hypothetical protein
MRRKHDQYFTPASACEVLKAHWDGWKRADHLIEPCVGRGDIVDSFQSKPWLTFDIDLAMAANAHADMTDPLSWRFINEAIGNRSCAVITNPPFKFASPIICNALMRGYPVAALLRLSFLEPTLERGPWLAENPPDKVIVLQRISFTGDGKTDSVTCAWMIWDQAIKDKGIVVSPR